MSTLSAPSKRKEAVREEMICQETVQVGVCRALNVQVTTADIIESFVVIHDGHVCVFKQRVDAKYRVVRLNDCGSHLGAGPDSETQLGLLAIVHREALQHEAAKTTAGASSDCIVDHEPLQACAVVGQLANTIEHQIHNFFANCVMAAGEVVGGVLLSGDELFRVEELAVGSSTHLIDHSRFEVNHHTARHVLTSPRLREKRIERVITTSNGLVAWHLTI